MASALENGFLIAVEFVGCMLSGMSWANLLVGHSDFKGLLLFAGSLAVPFLDSRLRRYRRPAVLLTASVLAGLCAVAIQLLSESWVRVLARILWLEGTDAAVLNRSYAMPFLLLFAAWFLLLWTIRRVRPGR